MSVPAAVGAKVAVNVTLCFAESVIGRLSPLTEKPVPLTVASEIVTADPPVLVNVSERLELLLSCTLPKDRVADDVASADPPVEPPLDPELPDTPWQPVNSAMPAAMKRQVKR